MLEIVANCWKNKKRVSPLLPQEFLNDINDMLNISSKDNKIT